MSEPDPRRYDALAPTLPDGPVRLPGLIPGEGPLELVVGFGRGRFLLERARAAPAHRVLGVELKAKWSTKVEARRIREGLDNARAFRADARALVARAGPDGCLARAFLHFPDPWWKKRHAKRRVLTPALLDHLARLLAPGGELFHQTDVVARAEEAAATIGAHPAFAVERLAANPYGARSNREARAERDGLPVHRLLGRRR